MVIWLFAGGGEAEIRGLVPFFRTHFSSCTFHRMTPVLRKVGPKPGIRPPAYGKTGKSLVSEVRDRLRVAMTCGERCNLILVIDDLDCRNENEQRAKFLEAIDSVDGATDIERFVGFAAPELESWIVADWENSVARHVDFRSRHSRMRHWLSKKIPFDAPESFGEYDAARDTCAEKLSEMIISSTVLCMDDKSKSRYRKAYHTPELLLMIDPITVKRKCPIFRKLYTFLGDCAI